METITPSSKFYEEFGNGDVPLRYMTGWSGCTTAGEWFDKAHLALDIVDSLNCSIDDLFEWSQGYRDAQAAYDEEAPHRTPPNYLTNVPGTCRQYVISMMQGGLTLRQIARWLEVCESDIVGLVCARQMPKGATVSDVLDADEFVWASLRGAEIGRVYTNAFIAKDTGLHRNTVARLRGLRAA